MTYPARAWIILSILALLAVSEGRVLSHTRGIILHRRAGEMSGRAPQGGAGSRVAMDSPFGAIPPPGASSATPWQGVDAAGRSVSIGPFNCYESVNFLTGGNAANFLYRSWSGETLSALDDPATWDRLEDSLHIGDVVEFTSHWRAPSGKTVDSTFHVQVCMGAHGLMGGANNEPRFDLVDGMPTYTRRWALCTTREYYAAARGMDREWIAFGRPMTYSIRVYRRPIWDEPSAMNHGEAVALREVLCGAAQPFTGQRSGSGIVRSGRG